MNTRLLATLEQVMQDWMDEHCQEDDYPTVLHHEAIAKQMASAASAVFAAMVDASNFTEEQMKTDV